MLFTPLLQQVVIDLATAHYHGADGGWVVLVGLANQFPKTALTEVFEAGDGQTVTQQAFRGHDHQRLATGPAHLPTQQMIELRRLGRNDDHHVVLRAQLQKTFEPGRGMLRPLTLHSVRQEQDQTAAAPPLLLTGADELVDHHLGIVGKVAELRLPHHQCLRVGGRVAILEGQHRLFAERRVDDHEIRLVVEQVAQRHISLAAALAVEDGVTMKKSAASGVLTGDAHRKPVLDQGRVGQRLGVTPVDRQGAGRHAPAVFGDLGHVRMRIETFRQGSQALGQGTQAIDRHACIRGHGTFACQIRRPVGHGVRRSILSRWQDVGRHGFARLQRLPIRLPSVLHRLFIDHALLDQPAGVAFTCGRQFADALVHQRLGDGRLVGLAVAVTAVADQVQHHILAEGHAVIDRQLHGEQHRLRIVTIEVQDWRTDHLGDIGAVIARTRILGDAGGEADLVVDDDVHRALGGIAAQFRQVEGLHHHALAGEGGIAVQDHRHHLAPAGVTQAFLTGAHRSLHHRPDDFEMRGIEGQRHVHRPARRLHVAGKTHVVFDVARAFALHATLELLEQVGRPFAENVHQHVQPAAMGHADHHLAHAMAAGALDQLIEHGDQRIAALQREALLAGVLGVQKALQSLGRRQPVEQALADLRRIFRPAAHALERALQPALLGGIGDVHVFGADGTTVSLLHDREDVGEPRMPRPDQRTGFEHRIEIGVGQPVMRQREFGYVFRRAQAEWVEIGHLVAAKTVGVDQLQDLDLPVALLQRDDRGGRGRGAGQPAEMFAHHGVRNIIGAVGARQSLEVSAPVGVDRGGVAQPRLEQLFEIGGVGAGQCGG